MGRWWFGGEMEVPTVAGVGTGAPTLSLEERQVVRSSGWCQLHSCCKGAEYFFGAAK